MSIGPNTALALSFSGVLGIYLECLRPGRAVAGCVGIALLLWGGYDVWLFGARGSGGLLLGLAVLLFLVDIFVNTRFLAGAAASAVLFTGLKLLLPPSHAFNGALTLFVSVVLGCVTTLACASARESRRNKRADLA
jgi:membrane-bound serine protease (ClpP class)